MEFELPKLDYQENELEPHISGQTVAIHYHKHHQGYLNKLKKAIGDTSDANKSLEELIQTSEGHVFNCAAQVWNHSFYWKSMIPNSPATPKGQLEDAINKDFGSLKQFKEDFAEAAKGEFGSGWAWLIYKKDQSKLAIMSSTDAENPLQSNGKQIPLLTIDVWEHAYYLDYQNERAKYIESYLEHLINWEFAAENYMRIDT